MTRPLEGDSRSPEAERANPKISADGLRRVTLAGKPAPADPSDQPWQAVIMAKQPKVKLPGTR